MSIISFYNLDEIAEEKLKYAVIVSKHEGKWIFCRQKKRATWELPAGHIEKSADGTDDEGSIDAAHRELYEETGATEYKLTTVCIYGVTRESGTVYGLLCFADIEKLGQLPAGTEIAEIRLCDTLPSELTYPEIQPRLFGHIQGWLNQQSNPDEMWDVYDENRHLTGRKHRRGDPLEKGEYHLVVHVWIQNGDGKYLLTKRAPNKGYPNMWECTAGSALAGDDSKTAAIREVKEETGLSLSPGNGVCVHGYRTRSAFVDVWLFRQEFDLGRVIFQPGETCGAMCATKDEILKMHGEGTMVPYSYLEEFFRRVEELS